MGYHMRKHEGYTRSPYQCSKSGRGKLAADLYHLASHEERRPWDGCNATFSDYPGKNGHVRRLGIHQSKHENDPIGPFQCSEEGRGLYSADFYKLAAREDLGSAASIESQTKVRHVTGLL